MLRPYDVNQVSTTSVQHRPRVTRPLPLRRDRPLPATRDAYGNRPRVGGAVGRNAPGVEQRQHVGERMLAARSEEHTSELQSPCNLVCRLLLEKKKKRIDT